MKKHTTVKSLLCSHVYCELDLKINRVHPHTMAYMSAKFDEEAHTGLASIMLTISLPYMSIETLTFDLLTSKINRVHPLTMANMSAKFDEEAHSGFSLYRVHKLISIYIIYHVTLTFDLQN